jgi:two-component system, cell cycle sensor histidine kinase and response regulator CckA
LDAAPPGPIRDHLTVIESASQRAAALTRQLLAVARKQMLRVEHTDVNVVVEQLVAMLRPLLDPRIALDCRLGPERLCVLIDPTQLQQALMNLVLNARDAVAQQGLIHVETAAVTLTPDTVAERTSLGPGRYVRIIVTDDGCGMDAHTAAHVFEPFFTTKPMGQGTGIGLATVHGLVKQSGGDISVSTKLGRGTTFVIHLPAIDEAALPRDRRSDTVIRARAAAGENVADQTVLVVDDEPHLAGAVERILGSAGYRVLVATSAAEALRLANDEPRIDLVLSDLAMPGASGADLTNRIRELRPETMIAFMSGNAPDERDPARADGTPVIAKPFASQELLDRVSEWLAPSDG